MPEKTKEQQKEIPLHDVVLEVMFRENKLKPAQLTANEIFLKLSDPDITEHNILEVLNWLVSHQRVDKFSGKYSLDRYEFLDQRKMDRANDDSKKRSSSKKQDPKSPKEEIPLHEVILQLMFDADKKKPAELTVNDIYWMTSDPSILEPQVGDVLKWLLHHRRVEYLNGKYSLDRFEFLDQTKTVEAIQTVKPKDKKISKEPEAVKSPNKVKPKIVMPPTPSEPSEKKKETVTPKPAEVKKKTITPKPKEKTITPKVKEKVVVPEAPKTTEPKKIVPLVKSPEVKVETPKIPVPVPVQQPINENNRLRTILLIVATCLLVYTCYLLISVSSSVTSESSDSVQDEIVSVQSKLKQLSESKKSTPLELNGIEEKLALIEEITAETYKQQDVQNQNIASHKREKSIFMRLLISNSLILLIFGFLLYQENRKRLEKKG